MHIEHWNTGRQYSPAGQRRAAMQVGDRIYFVDIDRNIDGNVKASRFPGMMRQTVMSHYDRGEYEPWSVTFAVEERKALKAAALGQYLNET